MSRLDQVEAEWRMMEKGSARFVPTQRAVPGLLKIARAAKEVLDAEYPQGSKMLPPETPEWVVAAWEALSQALTDFEAGR